MYFLLFYIFFLLYLGVVIFFLPKKTMEKQINPFALQGNDPRVEPIIVGFASKDIFAFSLVYFNDDGGIEPVETKSSD